MNPMIQQIQHLDAVIAAAIPLAIPLLEAAIRLIPSDKPMSLMHLASQFFHGLGDLASTVAGGLDAVVPQKITSAPKVADAEPVGA